MMKTEASCDIAGHERTVGNLLKMSDGLQRVPQLDCQLMLAGILGRSRTWLLAHGDSLVDERACREFISLVERRTAGEPLAYITGSREFWSLELEVTRDTLIPRPETELLVETALELLPDGERVVADLGTGSGAIAIALASERPSWSIVATDTDANALAVARSNARRLAFDNIEFVRADWCDGIARWRFDLIVSNPPYVEPGDPHLDELAYEPAHALISPAGGLADLTRIVSSVGPLLKPGGTLILEHGYNQQDDVSRMLQASGFEGIRLLRDLGGQPRAVAATRGNSHE